jgi:hypothetical protein
MQKEGCFSFGRDGLQSPSGTEVLGPKEPVFYKISNDKLIGPVGSPEITIQPGDLGMIAVQDGKASMLHQ